MIVRWCKSTRSSQGTVFIQTSPFYTELSGFAMRWLYDDDDDNDDGNDDDEDVYDNDDGDHVAQVWCTHLAFDGTLCFWLSGRPERWPRWARKVLIGIIIPMIIIMIMMIVKWQIQCGRPECRPRGARKVFMRIIIWIIIIRMIIIWMIIKWIIQSGRPQCTTPGRWTKTRLHTSSRTFCMLSYTCRSFSTILQSHHSTILRCYHWRWGCWWLWSW